MVTAKTTVRYALSEIMTGLGPPSLVLYYSCCFWCSLSYFLFFFYIFLGGITYVPLLGYNI